VTSVTRSPLAPRWKAASGSVTFSVDSSDGPVVVSVSDGEGVGPGPGATVVGSPVGVGLGPGADFVADVVGIVVSEFAIQVAQHSVWSSALSLFAPSFGQSFLQQPLNSSTFEVLSSALQSKSLSAVHMLLQSSASSATAAPAVAHAANKASPLSVPVMQPS